MFSKLQLPKFPEEITVTPTLVSAAPPSGGLAQKVPQVQTQTLTVLSDAGLKITQRFGEDFMESEYITASGVSKEQVIKAVKEAAHIPRSASFEIFNRYHLNATDGLIQVLYCKCFQQ